VTNIRMKIAAAATIFGLGGLGGFAMASNPANNAQTVASGQTIAAPVTTHTSGSAPVASVPTSSSTQPISTRTSGGAGTGRNGATEAERYPGSDYD
jgi:hypothetical protein